MVEQGFINKNMFIGSDAIGRRFYNSSTHYTSADTHSEPTLTYDSLVQITERFAVPTFNIQVTDFLPKRTVQAKRHKRKSSRRWQKKWLKRFGTKEVKDSNIYRIGNTILISPETHKKVMDKISDDMQTYERQTAWSFFGGVGI